jgi:CobQ-like glutamine amidotransferase family enzyme
MDKTITIAHLYPRDMSIYGDIGNVIALRQRLLWRGYAVKVDTVDVGDDYDFTRADIVFGGGGQDSGQLIVGPDLLTRGNELRSAALDGMPMLLICGLYQLFGRSFTTVNAKKMTGIGIFNIETTGSNKRMIGNITVETKRFGRLVGFENHSGQTLLNEQQEELGRVVRGYGNNDASRYEGSLTTNAVGTYMHGPVLPKNPRLTDALLVYALNRRYGITELAPLDDGLEERAAMSVIKRPQ